MTREQARAFLIRSLSSLNPRGRPDDIAIYADAFLDYAEASDNIAKNGNVVLQPRTGTPIENPYIKVKAQAISTIRKIRLKVGDLWSVPYGA